MTISGRWERRAIGGFADVVSGYAFKSSEFRNDGVPVIKIKNIRVGSVDLSNVEYVDEKFLRLPAKYHVRSGDVLISLTGSHISQPNSVVGRVARHGSNLPNCLLNQRGGKVIIRDATICDTSYLFYALSEPATVQAIAQKAHGAANQANVSPSQVESTQVPLPSLPAQRRIAGILSSYDDLIELSTRRIAILQEMACRVFDEWFVKLRFCTVDSESIEQTEIGPLPVGWTLTTLGNILETLESGSRPKGGVGTYGDVPSIGAENVLGLGRYDYTRDKFVSDQYFYSMKRGHVHDGDIMLYKDGAYIGRLSMAWKGFPHLNCAVNEHVFLLRAIKTIPPQFLFFWLDQPSLQAKIRGLNANAAQPGLNQPGVRSLPIMIPPQSFLAHFDQITRPIFDLLFNLALEVRQLRTARDLLLPRLIFGDIDLSAVEQEGHEVLARAAAE